MMRLECWLRNEHMGHLVEAGHSSCNLFPKVAVRMKVREGGDPVYAALRRMQCNNSKALKCN